MKATITVKTEYVLNQIDNLTFEYSPWLRSYEKKSKGKWLFKYDREKDQEGAGTGSAVINMKHLATGLNAMAKHSPNRFASVMSGDSDALDADAFIQCVIFGKLIYG